MTASRSARTLALWILLAAIECAVAAELEIPRPAMTDDAPAAGKFVRQIAEEYRGTQVFHGLYLPLNWQPGKTYPVIVEYAPNNSPQYKCSGRVEDCRMGYGLSGGRDFIWVVMPYVNSQKKENQLTWWGDEDATARYCVANLRRVCEQFGGDPNAVLVTGFSRGAIACGYIGLRDETIADIWLGFLPHSHIDGGRFTTKGALERLTRARGRPTFVTYGSDDNGKPESIKGAAILRGLKCPVVEREIANLGHADTWIENETPTRAEMRTWIAETLKTRPGTHTLSGRVLDAAGKGVAGARVQCGDWHWAITDAEGHYAIASLTAGKRPLVAKKTGATIKPERQETVIESEDIAAPDFVAGP